MTQVKFIPVDFGKRLQSRARKSTLLKMENMIELRDFYFENKEKIDSVQGFYEEAGDWMDFGAESVKKALNTIRNYPETVLIKWVKSGISFSHIETANWLQNVKGSKYTEALPLLNDVIGLGDENGKRMTVEKMIAFALGEKEYKERIKANFILSMFEKIRDFALANVKQELLPDFHEWLKQGARFFV